MISPRWGEHRRSRGGGLKGASLRTSAPIPAFGRTSPRGGRLADGVAFYQLCYAFAVETVAGGGRQQLLGLERPGVRFAAGQVGGDGRGLDLRIRDAFVVLRQRRLLGDHGDLGLDGGVAAVRGADGV